MRKLILILLCLANLTHGFAGSARNTLKTSSQRVNLGKPTTTTSQSACIWYRRPDAGCDLGTIYFSKYVAYPGCEFEIANNGAGGGSKYFGRADSSSGAYFSEYPTACTDASLAGWLHMCTSYPAGGGVTFYLNASAATTSATFTKTTSSSADLFAGSRAYPGGEGYSSGKFGHAQVYSKALSATEILELKSGVQNSLPRTSLTAEWTLMEVGTLAGTGGFKDLTGNGFNSTGNSATELTNDGPPIFYPGGQM